MLVELNATIRTAGRRGGGGVVTPTVTLNSRPIHNNQRAVLSEEVDVCGGEGKCRVTHLCAAEIQLDLGRLC